MPRLVPSPRFLLELVSKLVDEINDLLNSSENQISIIIVNDASNHDRKAEKKKLQNIRSIKILNMKIWMKSVSIIKMTESLLLVNAV